MVLFSQLLDQSVSSFESRIGTFDRAPSPIPSFGLSTFRFDAV